MAGTPAALKKSDSDGESLDLNSAWACVVGSSRCGDHAGRRDLWLWGSSWEKAGMPGSVSMHSVNVPMALYEGVFSGESGVSGGGVKHLAGGKAMSWGTKRLNCRARFEPR